MIERSNQPQIIRSSGPDSRPFIDVFFLFLYSRQSMFD